MSTMSRRYQDDVGNVLEVSRTGDGPIMFTCESADGVDDVTVGLGPEFLTDLWLWLDRLK